MRVVPSLFRALAIVLTVLSTAVGISNAQVTETRGTMSLIEGRRYYVAFPQVWASPSEKPLNPAMMLFVSSKVKATIRIKTPAAINQAARIDREFKLEPNKTYAIWVNTEAIGNFKDTDGRSAVPYLLVFKTKK